MQALTESGNSAYSHRVKVPWDDRHVLASDLPKKHMHSGGLYNLERLLTATEYPISLVSE